MRWLDSTPQGASSCPRLRPSSLSLRRPDKPSLAPSSRSHHRPLRLGHAHARRRAHRVHEVGPGLDHHAADQARHDRLRCPAVRPRRPCARPRGRVLRRAVHPRANVGSLAPVLFRVAQADAHPSLPTPRSCKRESSNRKSPLYSHFGDGTAFSRALSLNLCPRATDRASLSSASHRRPRLGPSV